MRVEKKFVFGMFFLIGILLLSLISAYSTSSPNYGLFDSYVRTTGSPSYDDVCDAGQDFLIQIAPFGCEPAVVRSDLLEEQNVPVFCQLAATKINPLIDVEAIESISFSGDYPPLVSGIGFHPAQAALGTSGRINTPLMENIGSVVIILEKTPAERDMPDSVEGVLTARLKYDIKNAFGLGDAVFYLPEMNDFEWESVKDRYSFWESRGTIRAESIDSNRATILVYDEFNKRLTKQTLEKGEVSDEIYFPNLDCLTTMEVKLLDLINPDTKARLNIDGDVVEVVEGGKFLDNKCVLRDIDKRGLINEVTIYCSQDEGITAANRNLFKLVYSPQVRISVDNEINNYVVGDLIFSEEGKHVYLGYVGSKRDSSDPNDLHVVLFESVFERGESLSKSTLEYVSNFVGNSLDSLEDARELNRVSSRSGAEGKFHYLPYGIRNAQVVSYDLDNNDVALLGFGSVQSFGTLTDEGGESFEVVERDYTVTESEGKYDIDDVEGLSFRLGNNNIIFDENLVEFRESEGVYVHDGEINLNNLPENYNGFFSNLESIKLNSEVSSIVSITVVKKAPISGAVSNVEGSSEFWDYYSAANADYDKILDNYPNVLNDGDVAYSEVALKNKIELAYQTRNMADLVSFCDVFRNEFSDSGSYETIMSDYCSDSELANSEISSYGVYVNGESKIISFKGVYEPTYEEFGADILVRTSDGVETVRLGRDQRYYLDGGVEYIQLLDIEKDDDGTNPDFVRLSVNLEPGADSGQIIGTKQLNEDQPNSFGSAYLFELQSINLKKEAKVSIEPSIKNAGTEANFSFKVGIEKRLIQLTPEKTKERINNLDSTINEWEGKIDTLGNLVSVMKGTCFAVETILTVKNFFSNVEGSAIARKMVMREEGGWYEKCNKWVGEGRYASVDDCLTQNNDEIEASVEGLTDLIQETNAEFESLGCIEEAGLFGTRVVDEECLRGAYITDERVNGLIERLNNEGITSVGDVNIAGESFVNILQTELSVTEFRDLEFASLAMERGFGDNFGPSLQSDLTNYYLSERESARINSIESDAQSRGYDLTVLTYGDRENTISAVYHGETVKGGSIDFNALEKFDNFDETQDYSYEVFNYKNEMIIAFLQLTGASRYNIIEVYGYEGVSGERIVLGMGNSALLNEVRRNFQFERYSSGDYENPFREKPSIRYYETEPNKGLPAVVPFDLENGWYAKITNAEPSLGGVGEYDESGRVRTFWLCNVWENGMIDAEGDDKCQRINLYDRTTYSNFAGLSERETNDLVEQAVEAIEAASRAYASGRDSVSIGGTDYNIGEPYADIPEMQCQDFMSPADCHLMFNVCDPVICPSSRCDYGGAYPVRDVVQTGIIGSIMLCLPNFREGIYVPVCLTGIHAGLEGYVSILKNHRDCLQESLDSGEMVGVCDEIYSIYLCEFFWRQALPLTKIAIPKLFEWIYGVNSRGGGEYLGVQSAWDSASESIDYFTDYYAVNSFQAFKARITDDVGGDLCKLYVSGVYPSDGDIFEKLTQPDSPPQFHGTFEAIPYSTQTVPPVSQYKVFYHIFAGEDSRAAYQVYLKAEGGLSYYEDTNRRIVASGYITKGDYASETIDFTAPTGFNELCIKVNQYEECGFQEVSTSFAVDYVNDLYLQEQAEQAEIKSEGECVSGTTSSFSLLSPNIQEGLGDAVNPDLVSKGITRICASRNPGLGTEEARWVDVGYCDDENVRCWLDKDSVSETIGLETIRNETLETLSEQAVARLMSEGDYLSEDEFVGVINNINSETDKSSKINDISNALERVFFNEQKAQLYFMRGEIYQDFALNEYGELIYDLVSGSIEGEGEIEGVSNGDVSTEGLSEENVKTAVCFYLNEGASEEFAAYMVGNLYQESRVNPLAVEPNGNGRGIVQWDVRNRWIDLQSWANGEGDCDFQTLDCQLGFTLVEGTQRNDLNPVLRSNGIEEIKEAIYNYERWGIEGGRWVYAKEILKKIDGGDYDCNGETIGGDEEETATSRCSECGSTSLLNNCDENECINLGANCVFDGNWFSDDECIGVSSCSDCSKFSDCDEDVCSSIGQRLGLSCSFNGITCTSQEA